MERATVVVGRRNPSEQRVCRQLGDDSSGGGNDSGQAWPPSLKL